jgi:protein-disulfide isomerase
MTALLRRLLPALLLGLVAALPLALPAAAQDAAPADQAAFEERVRAYLLAHPEVIVQALQELDRRQKVEAEAQQRQAIAEHRDNLLAGDGDPVAGNPAGAVTVVEFFDYRCPYCKAVAKDMLETLEAEGDVRIVFKEFPILGPDSQVAAKAALAANMQSRYLPFHMALMAHKGTLDRGAVLGIARDVGLDTVRLEQDMESAEVATVIARNLAIADSLDIGGTPAFVIGDTLVPGAVDMKTLRDLVAKARNG